MSAVPTAACTPLTSARGTALWDVEFGDGVIATPVVSDGTVYEAVFESSGNALHAIDAVTGEERWQFATENRGQRVGAYRRRRHRVRRQQ
jgi:outer membrane protein assembly factor BamB